MAAIPETGFDRMFNIPFPPSAENPRDSFSKDLEEQAHLLYIPDSKLLERTPVFPSFTIDGAYSKDLDDAIGIEKDGNDYIIHVSIADASALVQKNTPIDREAEKRGFTEYYGDTFNKPMIPRILSEENLSLHEGKLRPTITVSTPINQKGQTGEITINKTRLTSVKRFTYDEVDRIISNGVDEFGPVLKDCKTIAELLEERRRKRGVRVVFDLEKGIATSEEGVVREIPEEEEYVSDMIIREFMILTNEKVAETMGKFEIPVLYRNHDPKIQQRGFYSTDKIGHFGLGLKPDNPYLHFTSPIRRYPDLTVHRQISAFIERRQLPYSVEDLEEIAQNINLRQTQLKENEELKRQNGYKSAIDAIASDNFRRLNKADFRRAVRVALNNGGTSEQFEKEIIERLISEKLGAREVYMLLLRGNGGVKQEILNHIGTKGDLFKDILMMSKQISNWSSVSYSTEKTTEGFTSVAKVIINGEVFLSSSMNGKTINDSERAAGADIIKQKIGFN